MEENNHLNLEELNKDEIKLASEVAIVRKPQSLYKPRNVLVVPRLSIIDWIVENYPEVKAIPKQKTVDKWINGRKGVIKLRSKKILSITYVYELELIKLMETRCQKEIRQ